MWRMMVLACRLLAACGLVVVPLSAARAQPTENWGDGNDSCATAEQTLGAVAVEQWVLGYFTGVNGVTTVDHLVGHDTDAAGIMGEIQLECAANPSEAFSVATAKVYYKLQQEDQ